MTQYRVSFVVQARSIGEAICRFIIDDVGEYVTGYTELEVTEWE